MKKLLSIAKSFRDEESGAAMVEYSILIGIITAATIAIIIAVGGWVSGAWTTLCDNLDKTATTTATGASLGGCKPA